MSQSTKQISQLQELEMFKMPAGIVLKQTVQNTKNTIPSEAKRNYECVVVSIGNTISVDVTRNPKSKKPTIERYRIDPKRFGEVKVALKN
jgi:hypothetical protein